MRKFFISILVSATVASAVSSSSYAYRSPAEARAELHSELHEDPHDKLHDSRHDNLQDRTDDAVRKDSLSVRLDSIIVSGSRAGVNTPVTYSMLTKKSMDDSPSNYSLPMMLGYESSVVATNEGGLGLGYSKFSVRGSDPSRTNVTLNGVAISDAESQEMFWVNLPSLSGVLQSVQLQRGVGTSVNGPGQFGATMNMQTLSSRGERYADANFSYGSFRTSIGSFTSGTVLRGKGEDKFFADIHFTHSNSEGYIRNAGAVLNLFFLQTGWHDRRNTLKFIYMFGDHSTGLTWEGCPIEIYESGDRRYNPAGQYLDDAGNVRYYDNETDNYAQHQLQLHFVRSFSDRLSLNATLHFTKGDGYYENYKYNAKFSKYFVDNQTVGGVTYKKSDFIIRQQMDNSYYVANANLMYAAEALNLTGGVSYSLYDGDHFGNILWSKYNAAIPAGHEWYRNNGRKDDASAYLKAEYEPVRGLTVYGDLQYRYVGVRMKGIDKDIADLDYDRGYDFFNPKAGVSYRINDRSRAYFSVAVGRREPSRSDVKESVKAGKAGEMRSERLVDYELGYKFSSPAVDASVNFYAMEYKDQLVATGRLTETGYTIQENIPDSYRHGVEIAAAVRAARGLEFFANATLSKNKIRNYTFFTDTYDNAADWNPLPQTALFLRRSNLSFSPEVVAMAGVGYSPCESMAFRLNFKQVGRQYMDNSSSEISRVPSYNTLNLNISKSFRIKGAADMKIAAHIDNLLNRKYYSYGWIYRALFADGSADYVEKSVFAQATVNFLLTVTFSF